MHILFTPVLCDTFKNDRSKSTPKGFFYYKETKTRLMPIDSKNLAPTQEKFTIITKLLPNLQDNNYIALQLNKEPNN